MLQYHGHILFTLTDHRHLYCFLSENITGTSLLALATKACWLLILLLSTCYFLGNNLFYFWFNQDYLGRRIWLRHNNEFFRSHAAVPAVPSPPPPSDYDRECGTY